MLTIMSISSLLEIAALVILTIATAAYRRGNNGGEW